MVGMVMVILVSSAIFIELFTFLRGTLKSTFTMTVLPSIFAFLMVFNYIATLFY